MPARRRVKPELLAPAGDRSCLIAAVENGADAIYFGLERHNARIRASNFEGADLPEIMALLHRRGVRGYVTLNTLVFPHELAELEAAVRELTIGRRRRRHRARPWARPAHPGRHARSRDPRVDSDVDHERRKAWRLPASWAARA